MFENLRAAFREAVDNFKNEVGRDQVPEAVDQLLRGMIEEATEAKTRLRDLESGIERAQAEALREKRQEATCVRREEMARQIGDEDTAKVAADFAEKHRARKQVLEGKAEALKKELEVRKAEIEDMLEQIRDARKRRDSLTATSGRSSARESIRGSSDLFDELDRMADKIGGDSERDSAERDLLDEFAPNPDYSIDTESPSRRPVDVDERLEELKRRMGED